MFSGKCLRDSEAEQRALQVLHMHCSNVNSYSSAPESNRPNPRDGTLDLPSLKSLPLSAPIKSLPFWFQGNFAATIVLNFWLREFLLSAFANHFELRCEPKQLYYKICPCYSGNEIGDHVNRP